MVRWALLSVLTFCSCTYRMAPELNIDSYPRVEGGAIDAKALLLLPEDFLSFKYVSSYEGREITYFFGQAGIQPLTELLRSAFSTLDQKSIGSELEAFALVRSSGDSLSSYDFLILPKFIDTNSFVKPFQYSVETGIRLDFVAKDHSITTARGSGTGSAGLYISQQLRGAGKEALTAALAALRDDIASKREVFLDAVE